MVSTPVLPAHRRNERAAVTTARWRPLGQPLAVMRRAFCRRMLFPIFFVAGVFVAPPSIAANIGELDRQLQMIEVDLLGFPGRAEAELDALAAHTRAADGSTRRFGAALLGQARVAAAHIDLALNLADQLEQEGRQSRNDATAAVALLIRSDAHVWRGDVPHANLIANNARTLAQNADDSYVRYWAAMAFGITGRMLGQVDAARASLREAYVIADNAQNPYRRAAALYQLSVLDRMTRQADRALAQSQQAFAEAKLAGSTFGMAKAKMAESAALEVLDRPVGELAAMQEALAIARAAGSGVEESLALINLADIHLRRKDFDAVLEVSRQSLELATRSGDGALIATNKANMGFALFGLGRTDAGKRLAEEALAETERTGASAEIVDLMEEYGRYLASAGDYRAALALRDRQHKVMERIAATTRKRDLLEYQSKFDSERRINKLELENQESQQRVWWMFAAMFALSFLIVAFLYRKVQMTNRLLARRNTELGFYSTRDPLTSLYNRRHFQNFIGEAPAIGNRRSVAIDHPAQAILLIDLDHFKSINDHHGHAAGDAVLIAVAQRLRDALRETEMIVRWGGEEFLVFIPMVPADRVDEIVLRVLRAVSAEPINCQGTDIHVTASIGYAPMPLSPSDAAAGWEHALDLADRALYEAKKRGRNRAVGVAGSETLRDGTLVEVDAGTGSAAQDDPGDAGESPPAAAARHPPPLHRWHVPVPESIGAPPPTGANCQP
jgi:diguanylate cyclase (GGDEF)-like protein